MQETIDLIARRELRNLRAYTKETGQPTKLSELDLGPMNNVQSIEIDEEHVTVHYNTVTERKYNANTVTRKEWTYKFNDDAEFVAAVKQVIDLSRKHMYDLPENIACPPGCAECCSGYEPFVSRDDVQRIADRFAMTYDEVMKQYVVARDSADGFSVGWLRKVDDDGAYSDDAQHKCVFLMGPRSGRYYCGIYESRPHDCAAFTPIGCDDVDTSLPRGGEYRVGKPFTPKRAPVRNGKARDDENRRMSNGATKEVRNDGAPTGRTGK